MSHCRKHSRFVKNRPICVVILIICMITGVLLGCGSSVGTDNVTAGEEPGNIKSLTILRTDDIQIDVGKSTSPSWVQADLIDRDTFSPDDVEFISEDPSIASIEFSHDALTVYLYYSVTGVSNGETYVYARAKEGGAETEHVKVIVNGEIQDISIDDTYESDLVAEEEDLSNDTQDDANNIKVMYATTKVNVRSQPSTEAEIAGSLGDGQSINVINDDGEWCEVDFNGTGYVKSEFLSDDAPSTTKAIQEANENSQDSEVSNAQHPEVEVPVVQEVEPVVETPATVALTVANTGNSITLSPETVGYLSATGEKFHRINNCGTMNPDKARMITAQDAFNRGYEACENCW